MTILFASLANASELGKLAKFTGRQRSTVLSYNRLGGDVVLVSNGIVRQVALPSGTTLTSKPAPSPDRSLIAYTATTMLEGFLVIQNSRTGEIHRMESSCGYDPDWSPDGKRLATAYSQK